MPFYRTNTGNFLKYNTILSEHPLSVLAKITAVFARTSGRKIFCEISALNFRQFSLFRLFIFITPNQYYDCSFDI